MSNAKRALRRLRSLGRTSRPGFEILESRVMLDGTLQNLVGPLRLRWT